ncbi:MAG TPA: hypothetical protein VIV15_13420, partial [Anaerolineales bacterium]
HDGPQMHCALGIGVLVAMEQGVPEYDELDHWIWHECDLPWRVMQFYGLESVNPLITIDGDRRAITSHNDNNKHSFWTIAQAMRAEFLKDES